MESANINIVRLNSIKSHKVKNGNEAKLELNATNDDEYKCNQPALKRRKHDNKPGSCSTEGENSIPDDDLIFPKEFDTAFVTSIFEAGLKNASPMALLNLMPPYSSLSAEHIKSHLQKYRMHSDRSKVEFVKFYCDYMKGLFDACNQKQQLELKKDDNVKFHTETKNVLLTAQSTFSEWNQMIRNILGEHSRIHTVMQNTLDNLNIDLSPSNQEMLAALQLQRLSKCRLLPSDLIDLELEPDQMTSTVPSTATRTDEDSNIPIPIPIPVSSDQRKPKPRPCQPLLTLSSSTTTPTTTTTLPITTRPITAVTITKEQNSQLVVRKQSSEENKWTSSSSSSSNGIKMMERLLSIGNTSNNNNNNNTNNTTIATLTNTNDKNTKKAMQLAKNTTPLSDHLYLSDGLKTPLVTHPFFVTLEYGREQQQHQHQQSYLYHSHNILPELPSWISNLIPRIETNLSEVYKIERNYDINSKI
eukprot:gene5945-11996_t